MKNELMLNPESATNAKQMAMSLSKSKMVPYSLAGKPEDIFAIMLYGHELNIPAMTALQNISVIQGKPSVSPQMMLAMVYRALPDAIIKTTIDENKKIVTVFAARNSDQKDCGYTATWNQQKVDAMGLTGKDNYRKQFINMCKWRATAEACRVVFPDIILGLYLPMEFQDLDGKEIPEIRTVEQELDESHPIPEEEKEIGSPNYRFQYRKFRGKQLKEIDIPDLEERLVFLEKKIAGNKADDKDREEVATITLYLTNLETQAID